MTCPNIEVLRDLASGKLVSGEFETVAAHVRTCSRCRLTIGGPDGDAADSAKTALTRTANAEWWNEVASPHRAEDQAPERATSIGQDPEFIGPYRIDAVLARGGMGIVYRATSTTTGKVVAVKAVVARQRAMYASLREEVAVLQRARHPGVVEILDCDTSGSTVWYAMELLVGETMQSRIHEIWSDRTPRRIVAGTTTTAARGESPTELRPVAADRLAEVIELFAALCEPLSFVHRAGIVHCDLKPANVFLRSRADPVVMDFGLVARARGAIGREELQAPGRARGTLPYISPEVIRGELADARADLYALGCMLFEALTGELPFWSARPETLLRMHLEAQAPSPSALVAGVPAKLDQLVLGLLAKRREDRIGHADDVSAALASLEGSVSPPRAIRSRSAAPGFLFRPALVGRDDALAEAFAFCRGAAQGRGACVLVAGESGIGKTFFASELSQRAAMNGMLVITGDCVHVAAAEGATNAAGGPLHAFRRVLQHVTDRCREVGAIEQERLLGPHIRVLAPYEPGLASLPAIDALSEPPPLPAAAARERLINAVIEVIRRLAEDCPLLLAVDDLQWADDLSLAVVGGLQKAFFEETPFVFVGTYRTDEMGEPLRQIATRQWVRTIHLRRLDEGEVGQVVGDMLAISRPPATMVRHVHAQSEGVPFFVAEYLRAIAVEGLLERDAGRWTVRTVDRETEHAMAAIAFPARLAELLRRRLTGLRDETLRALDAAAVIGHRFDVTLLASVLNAASEQVTRSLIAAVHRQIIEQVTDGAYQFAHHKIRETLYGDIDPARRRELHGSTGRAIVATQAEADGAKARYGELAVHFQAAGDAPHALDYLELAGRHALRFAADMEAADHFRNAIRLQQSSAAHIDVLRRASWQRLLGEALQGVGKLNESTQPLAEAVALLGHPVPAAKIHWSLGIARQLGAQAVRRLLPSFAPARHQGGDAVALEAGRAFDRLQRAYFHGGRPVELLFANLSGLNLLELASPTPELASALCHAAATAGFMPVGDGRLALHYFDLAQRALAKSPDAVVESYLHMLLALYFGGRGKQQEAAEHADLAISIARRTGSLRAHDECVAVRAGIELAQGRHQDAAGYIATLEASAKRRGDAQMLAWALLQKATCALLRGDAAASAPVTAQIEPLLPELARPEAIWFHALEAHALVGAGALEKARHRADRAQTLIDAGPLVQSYLVDAFGRLAETRLACCRQTGARADREAAAAACAVLTGASRVFRWAAPMAHLHRGALLAMAGKRAAAHRLWRAGLALTEPIDVPYDEARLSLALAASLRGRRADIERPLLRDRASRLLAPLHITTALAYPAT